MLYDHCFSTLLQNTLLGRSRKSGGIGNGVHQLIVYDDDVDLLDGIISTVKETQNLY